jgi:membrane associated rhomboid family serine protease
MKKTQRLFNALLTSTILTSLLGALSDSFIPAFSIQKIFSLSLNGIEHHQFWQLISYLFVQPLENGISFGFLFKIAFNTYLLFLVGGSILHKKGVFHFLSLYFLGGLFSSLVILGLLILFPSPLSFAGNMTALYSLLIAWITLNPQATFPFLLGIPIRAKTLIFAFFGINCLIDLSSGNWIYALSYLAAALFGYLYGLLLRQHTEKTVYTRGKIFDFKTGEALLNDDQFLEEMLSKIAVHGKKSLTWKERWRLRKIVKNKKKKI